MTLALVMPAHNERAHIRGVIGSVPSWVDRIAVVDDGSTDGTADVVAGLHDERVRLIRHERNRGVGAAMRTGYRAVLEEGWDLIGKIDADGQMCTRELTRLVRPFVLGVADYTKGNRFYFSKAAASMPRQRGFGNTVLSFLTKASSGYWHVYDPQCGFTVVSATFLRLLDLDDLPDDYFFENAMLIKLNGLNARVVDVPTTTRYGQEVSGVSIRRVAATFPPRLVLAGARRFWRKHLVTDFGAVGMLTLGGDALSLFGVAFGSYHWWKSVTTGHAATTGTVMVAVLPLVVGFQMLVQAFSMSVLSSPGGKETADYVRRLIREGEFEDAMEDGARHSSGSGPPSEDVA